MMGTEFPGSGFGGNCSSNVFQKLGGLLQGGDVIDCVDTTLRLDPLSSRASHLPISKGVKRKCNGIDENMAQQLKETLALGLGYRSSSSSESKHSSVTACTGISTAKESEEESSQNFSLRLGTEKSPSPNKPASLTLKPVSQLMKVDLELSLSTVSSESDIASVHQDSPVMQIVDGCKTGNCLPNFLAPEIKEPDFLFKPVPMITYSASFGSDLLTSVPTPPKSSVTYTSRSSSKLCKFTGCSKGARGASGLCIAHGGGRRCQKSGCNKGAEGRTPFCKAHGGGRRCQFLGCTKSAEGRTDFCIAHGGGRRCTFEHCTKAARGKSGLCIKHGGGKRCQWENCTRSAEGHSGLCISHGGGRRCQYPSCTKGAQGSTMLCKAHGGGKRCTVEGCTKGAEGSTPFCKGHGGGKRCNFVGCSKCVHGGTSFCVAHGGGKRCAVSECTKSARGRTDFCARHGGGKRCKFEGCGKSAQGSTDFCKAHGGGKRCSWADGNCGLFARGKAGLCVMHGALVQDKRVHGGVTLGPLVVQDHESAQAGKFQNVFSEGDTKEATSAGSSAFDMNGIQFSTVEKCNSTKRVAGRRVHGGSLLAMLSGGSRV